MCSSGIAASFLKLPDDHKGVGGIGGLPVFERYRMRHPQAILGGDAFYGAPESIRITRVAMLIPFAR